MCDLICIQLHERIYYFYPCNKAYKQIQFILVYKVQVLIRGIFFSSLVPMYLFWQFLQIKNIHENEESGREVTFKSVGNLSEQVWEIVWWGSKIIDNWFF